MTVAEGFEAIVSACLLHFRLNERAVTQSRHIEALHQARVAIRRLRSALSLFRPMLSHHELEQIEHELRWLTAELGDARTLDVYLERELSEEQRQFVGERREQAYVLAIAAMNSPRFQQLMDDISRWVTAGPWREKSRAQKPLQSFANHRIDALWSDISKSKKVAKMDDLQRHHLRIRMKRLRYALEFVGTLHEHKPRRKKKFTKAIDGLQESLGSLHDIVTARSLAALNSWLAVFGSFDRDERRIVRNAGSGLKRLQEIGPYWH